jgi:hypothetical protein
MTALLIIAVVWIVVALALCERNRRKNPLEHGAENAVACLWPIFGPFVLAMIVSDWLKGRGK